MNIRVVLSIPEDEFDRDKFLIAGSTLVDVFSTPDDIWSEDLEFPRRDWMYEAGNGDTLLGYWEWVNHQRKTLTD